MKWGILIILGLILIVNISFAQEVRKQEVPEPPPEVALAETTAPGVITFSFKDADIRNVLRLIAAKSGVNIVYGPEVTGVVNMELKDVPWEQALGLVLDINGFAYQREGNVIKVLKKEDVAKEPLATEVFVMNYYTVEEKDEKTEKQLKNLLTERGSLKIDKRSNSIIITDVPANINKIEAVLARLDIRTPQVLIETKIVEMKNTKEKDLGLKWTSLKEYTIGFRDPKREYSSERSGGQERTDKYTTTTSDSTGSGTSVSITSDPITGLISTGTRTDTSTVSSSNVLGRALTDTFTRTLLKSDIRTAVLSAADFELVLSALQSQTDVNLVSNPRILTANNETAQIKVVDEYPIPKYTFDTATSTFTISGFEYKDIGVTFDVTPNISADGYITMKIEPQTSELLGTIPFTASGSTVNIPLVGLKKASAKLVIRSGDTLAVGGLVSEDKSNVVTKVPLLGDIPVLGRLFRHENVDNTKKDIIFFITATIIDEKTRDLILESGPVAEESPEVYPKVFGKLEKTVEDRDLSSGNRGIIQGKR